MDGTVLVADDDRSIRTVLTQALTRAGCKVHATGSLGTLRRWVEDGMGDAVITDVMMPDGNGLDVLPGLRALRPDLPVIVISAQNTMVTALRAEEADAWDYLPKPFDLPDLMARVARALNAAAPAKPGTPPAPADGPLIGQSADMQALYIMIAKIIHAPLPVMILGESGVGKSLVAQVIHDASDHATERCVTLRGEDILNAEDVGSFLTRIRAGSVVFDDIDGFCATAQSRLVRMIDAAGPSGPRVMSTGSANVAQHLRDDLYYRLAGVSISVPPLRARPEDIALHAAHVLGDGVRLLPDALAAAKRYRWPGNMRQFENVMRTVRLAAKRTDICAKDIEDVLASQPLWFGAGGVDSLGDSIAHHIGEYFAMHGGDLPPAGLYGRLLPEFETPLIDIALRACGGNQAKCAQLLGINRNTLRKKITDHGIEVTRGRRVM